MCIGYIIMHLSYMRISSLFIANQYHKENIGHNCPADKIIATADKCEDALKVLRLNPLNLNVNQIDRPAGCYWRSDGNGYFNHVFNPLSTDTNAFGNRGGVCSLAGINF